MLCSAVEVTCDVPEVLIYIFHEDAHRRLVISRILNITNITILNLSTGLIKFNYHYHTSDSFKTFQKVFDKKYWM